jgi:hypothetical protein
MSHFVINQGPLGQVEWDYENANTWNGVADEEGHINTSTLLGVEESVEREADGKEDPDFHFQSS